MTQRIVTAAIALVVFLPILSLGGIPFTLLVYAMATIGLLELLRMRKLSLTSFEGILSFILLWILLLPQHTFDLWNMTSLTKMELIFGGVILYLAYTVVVKNKFTFDDIGFMLISILYVGIGFYYFIEIREAGLVYIAYALLVVWVTDSGAYFVGRAMGKRKLWPDISPNKTIEGSIGGIICALVVAVLFVLFSDIQIPVVTLMIMTVLLSIFGQIGDLAESALKRHYQVKDSGNIMPGHGGILDRFDSLLFVLPLLHLLLNVI